MFTFDHAQRFEATTDSRYGCTVNLTGGHWKYGQIGLLCSLWPLQLEKPASMSYMMS